MNVRKVVRRRRVVGGRGSEERRDAEDVELDCSVGDIVVVGYYWKCDPSVCSMLGRSIRFCSVLRLPW